MAKDIALCMDIGGTFIKYALVEKDGTLSGLKKQKTNKQNAILSQVFSIIEELREVSKDSNLAGIGISSAGQINHDKGVVLSATDNLPGWAGVNLKGIIEDKYSVVCHTDNDVKCAALGELYFGNGRNVKNFVCIALGTGVGGAIIENGRLLRGMNGIAGELGHIVIKAGGRKCNCGNRGCYEQYASVTALKRMVSEKLGNRYLPKDTGVEWLFDRYDQDDRLKGIIDQFAGYISTGIVSLVNTVNPSAVIIGGAISSCSMLMDMVAQKVYENTMPVFNKDLKIIPALTGNNASLLGASTYIFNKNMQVI